MSDNIRKILFGLIAALLVGTFMFFQMKPNNTQNINRPVTAQQEKVQNSQEPTATTSASAEGDTGDMALAHPLSSKDLNVAASRAIDFITFYNSYGYQQTDAEWSNKIAPYLAKNSQINTQILPTGAEKQRAVSEKRVIEVTNADVKQVLLESPDQVILQVAYETATTANGNTTKAQATENIELTNENGTWRASNIIDNNASGEAE